VVVGRDVASYMGNIFTKKLDKMEKKIWAILEKIDDPELGVSLAGLGLVYKVKEKAGKVGIKMSLTSMGCPLFDVIEGEIKEKVGKLKGVKKVEVELVWDPPWHQGMMNEEVKAELGIE